MVQRWRSATDGKAMDVAYDLEGQPVHVDDGATGAWDDLARLPGVTVDLFRWEMYRDLFKAQAAVRSGTGEWWGTS